MQWAHSATMIVGITAMITWCHFPNLLSLRYQQQKPQRQQSQQKQEQHKVLKLIILGKDHGPLKCELLRLWHISVGKYCWFALLRFVKMDAFVKGIAM